MEHEPDGSTWQSTCDIWLAALDNTYRELVQAAAAFVPGLVGATLLFVLGWLLAIALRALILRLGTGIDRMFYAVRDRPGQDPAQSSSIVLTTVTDVTGFFSFLGIATLLAGMI